jgi:ABC-2 type transport system ATP-binding protein
MPASVVELLHVTKSYGLTPAVDDLSLEIAPGEVFGFLGPNGAGKSTTIRLLLGLIAPTRGEVRVLGKRVTIARPPLADVGALIERPALYPHLNAFENLRQFVAVRNQRISNDELRQTLAAVGLDGASSVATRRYSTGMRQRLGLAMAVLGRPSLVILDEPTEGLDPVGVVHVRTLIRSLIADGTTVFMSSHQLTEVDRLCTRVAILVAGRVVRDGRPRDLVAAGERVVLVFEGEQAAETALSTLAGMGFHCVRGDEAHTVEVGASGDQTPALIRALDSQGIAPARLSTQTQSLEDLFLEVASTGAQR